MTFPTRKSPCRQERNRHCRLAKKLPSLFIGSDNAREKRPDPKKGDQGLLAVAKVEAAHNPAPGHSTSGTARQGKADACGGALATPPATAGKEQRSLTPASGRSEKSERTRDDDHACRRLHLALARRAFGSIPGDATSMLAKRPRARGTPRRPADRPGSKKEAGTLPSQPP